MNCHHFNKTPFLNFLYGDYRPTPPPALPVYPAGVLLPTPAHPERLHITGGREDHATHRHTRPKAGHAAPVCTRYQTAHDGQIVPAAGCWSAGSASDRARPNEQKRNELFRLFFYPKALTK
nr:MAG TPA: hypothetical protein [Caudoviricetes sp.]